MPPICYGIKPKKDGQGYPFVPMQAKNVGRKHCFLPHISFLSTGPLSYLISLVWAGQQNPGKWVEHSRFVALACKNIAAQCDDMSAERAYCFGLLHDIGRYAGISSERHLIDGYRFCMERGWKKQHKSAFPMLL